MKKDKGFTLLVAIVVTSMMLIVSFVVANVALKQLVLADAGVESQYAFYNADSGADCAVYWDLKRGNNGVSPFATSTAGSISCGSNTVTTGSQTVTTVPTQTSVVGGGGNSNPTSIFQLDYAKGCAIVRVTKRNDGYTFVDSRGYNNCNTTAIKRYERGITLTYQGDENTITGSSGNSGTVGHIVLSLASFNFSANVGVTPASQNVTIQNTGPGSMAWTATPDQSWCHLSPSSGTINSGSSVVSSISVDSASSAGTYSCTIPVTSTTADNSPQNIAVTDTVANPYVCATATGTIDDLSSGNYKIYRFKNTAGGTLVVTCPGTIEVLVVGGGGGGAWGDTSVYEGGGGGAGGYIYNNTVTVSNGTYTIGVGLGGAGGAQGANPGNGNNSSFIGPGVSLTALGGGAGGEWNAGNNGISGGSGGGGGTAGCGGAGTAGQGNAGGCGVQNSHDGGGGGGGAGAVGGTATYSGGSTTGGNGGAGLSNSISNITNTMVFYAGGGGGGGDSGGVGGNGGGGNQGFAGTANLGGGGGGGSGSTGNVGGAGGKGVVIVKFRFQ